MLLDWYYVSLFQSMSNNFIYKYKDYLDITSVIINNISVKTNDDILSNLFKYIDWNIIIEKDIIPYEQYKRIKEKQYE